MLKEANIYKMDKKRRKSTNCGLSLKPTKPITHNQQRVFDSFINGKNQMMLGSAGTGKTFIALYLALSELQLKNTNKVVICRSAVPTREMGFLPGNEKEKSRVYEAAYDSICSELYGRGDAYGILKQHNIIEFVTTSFIRSTTIENSVVIVDECQNMTGHELSSVITRVGVNTRIMFIGDYKQGDLKPGQSGIGNFSQIVSTMQSFDCIAFGIDDVVRSGLVKEFLLAEDAYNNS